MDDNEEHRSLLAHWLEMHGHQVVQAADGIAAEDAALRSQPHVILMDITMPQMDGFAATRRVLARTALHDVPVIAVSALIREEVLSAALAAGCSAVISKPIDYDLLEATINKYLQPKADPSREQIN